MGLALRLLTALVALALVAPAGAATPRPITSAPSEYVEVVPTAGGGVPAGSNSHRARSGSAGTSASVGSAGGAAVDAVGGFGGFGVVVFGVAIVAVTAGLVAAAVSRRRRPHVPNG